MAFPNSLPISGLYELLGLTDNPNSYAMLPELLEVILPLGERSTAHLEDVPYKLMLSDDLRNEILSGRYRYEAAFNLSSYIEPPYDKTKLSEAISIAIGLA